jgi:hypothetical protein
MQSSSHPWTTSHRSVRGQPTFSHPRMPRSALNVADRLTAELSRITCRRTSSHSSHSVALPNKPIHDQARLRCAPPRAGTCARPPALGRPRPAPAGLSRFGPRRPSGLTGRRSVLYVAVFLDDLVSHSRQPCIGRFLRSRRMRSASANLDTAPAREGSAPVEGPAAGMPTGGAAGRPNASARYQGKSQGKARASLADANVLTLI